MTRAELTQYLANHARYAWQDDGDDLLVIDRAFDPPEVTRIAPHALASHTVDEIVVVLAGGRDVEHITRVTGYFSKTSGWNKGKEAELRDRHRVRVS